MTFETFKICIDKIPLDVTLSFAGFSEPWLNRDCTKMILYAFDKGHKHIHAATTLAGMEPADIEQLEEIPLELFRVHLPSSNEYENINISEYYMKLLSKLDKSKINKVYHYHCSNKPHPNLNVLIKDKAVHVLTMPRSICTPEIVDITLSGKKRGALECGYYSDLRGGELLPNGDVLLCCMDFGMKHVLGSMLAQDYESIFSGKEILKIKEALKNKSSEIICRQCEISRNVNLDLDCCINLLNSDIRILVYKALKSLNKSPMISKCIKLLGMDKIHMEI